jgi:hypothetical protein
VGISIGIGNMEFFDAWNNCLLSNYESTLIMKTYYQCSKCFYSAEDEEHIKKCEDSHVKVTDLEIIGIESYRQHQENPHSIQVRMGKNGFSYTYDRRDK